MLADLARRHKATACVVSHRPWSNSQDCRSLHHVEEAHAAASPSFRAFASSSSGVRSSRFCRSSAREE
jgi:hypothetical protein